MGIRDLFWRSALIGLDRTVGARSARARAVCQYGLALIESGGRREFQALVRHRLTRAIGRRHHGRRPPVAKWRGIAIDAKSQRLTLAGTVVSKPSITYSGGEAPVLVSVVIPCHDYGAFLDEALESIKAQTLASVEIIIVDDGSTDPATRAVIDRLESEAVVVVLRQSNRGLSAARNSGIARARGEYICCLDADDRLAPTYLEQAIAVLESDCAVGFAYSWAQFFGDTAEVWPTHDFDADEALIGNFTSGTAVFRRDDWRAAGGLCDEMRDGFEDWEFWIRLASLGRRGRCIERPLFFHRRHGRTMTHTAKERELQLRGRMRALFPEFYAQPAVRRRLMRLRGVPDRRAPTLAMLTAVQRGRVDSRPGLLVVVTGLLRGGAHTMLRDVLAGLRAAWRIVIVTTGERMQPMEAEFAALTAEIFHLHGFLDLPEWRSFVDHLVGSRHVSAALSTDCRWWLDSLEELTRMHPTLKIFDIIHNHVPTRTFRAAVGSAGSIDRHIAVSSMIGVALQRAGIAAERIISIPNGVDTEGVFEPGGVDRAGARRALGVAPSARLLIWIGRLSDEKRPDLFVQLMKRLGSAHGDLRGLMVGDGPLAHEVDASVQALRFGDRLERRPHMPRQDLARIYAAADLLVLTSSVEGLPLVVLEALAMGCPVVATDVGDVARAVVNGVNGLVVPADDEQALVRAVAGLVGNDARRGAMRQQAVASIRQSSFQLTRMVDAYARLLGGAKRARGAD